MLLFPLLITQLKQEEKHQTSEISMNEHKVQEKENKLKGMAVQLQEQHEELSIEREKLAAWIQDNKQKAGQLETLQKELTEREHECSEKENDLSALIQNNKQKACQLEGQQRELAEKERECNKKEVCLKTFEAKLQAREYEQNIIEANQESILVSQSSQTRSLEMETSNACIQANLSAPQISQASQAETEETNASVQTILEAHQIHTNQDESIQAGMLMLQSSPLQTDSNNIPIQVNMPICKTSKAVQVETSENVHQHRQANQDESTQISMSVPQSNKHDKAVQVNIPLPAGESSPERYPQNWDQQIKKHVHNELVNMTNYTRDMFTELHHRQVSELKV